MKVPLTIPVLFLLLLQNTNCSISYNLIDGLQNVHITEFSEKIGHTWNHGHVWEKHLIQKFYYLIKQHNDFFIAFDLGAQTGSFSLLAKYFPHSQWYAFEPIQEAAQNLKENLDLNNIKNVFISQVAVSNFCGEITLKMPATHEWGLTTIGQNPLRFKTVSERKVNCISIDNFVQNNNIQKVHFMKLDTEGSELFILQGARNTILRDHPIMIMEYNETNMKQCGVLKKQLNDFLTEMEYQWKLISSEDILCIPNDGDLLSYPF